MSYTFKVHYALTAVLTIVQQDKIVNLSQIAKKYNFPQKFLEQLFLKLKKHNIVKSKRGRYGGYVLAKKPSEITMSCVFKAVDPHFCAQAYFEKNMSLKGDCNDFFSLHYFWLGLYQRMQDYCESITLQDIAEQNFQFYFPETLQPKQ